MLDKLQLAEDRYDIINEKLMDPAVINDQNEYKNLMKEYKNLTPIVDKYREYKKAKEEYEEAKGMLDDGGLDKDFKEIVELQYMDSKEKMV
ncbi:MAG: PCRF domain-containing protein, partial [Oscillospiraceae bacterium]